MNVSFRYSIPESCIKCTHSRFPVPRNNVICGTRTLSYIPHGIKMVFFWFLGCHGQDWIPGSSYHLQRVECELGAFGKFSFFLGGFLL